MKIYKSVFQVALLLIFLTILLGVDKCGTQISTPEQLEKAFVDGGKYVIVDDIPFNKKLIVKNGITVELRCLENSGSHTITYNGSGPGFWVEKGGTLNTGADGGKILNIRATYFKDKDMLIVNDGSLYLTEVNVAYSNSKAGILVTNTGLFDLSDKAKISGVVFNADGGIFNMYSVAEIESSSDCVKNAGDFIMYGGKIYGTGYEHGGVANFGKFTMDGIGEIYKHNWGVMNGSGSTFIIKEGSIHEVNTVLFNDKGGKYDLSGGYFYDYQYYVLTPPNGYPI